MNSSPFLGKVFCVNFNLSKFIDGKSNNFCKLFVLQNSCIKSIPTISERIFDIFFLPVFISVYSCFIRKL